MNTYRVAQVAVPSGPFCLVEREVPRPGPGHVRLAVEAYGICHSDDFFVSGGMQGVRFPPVPGHEVAGRIEELGEATGGSDWGRRARGVPATALTDRPEGACRTRESGFRGVA
ncbi:alcohol dehydrogenase catalytic domain-containing protein [Streptomyces bobili]|uniref:alcohol dehydrogenase catalytic domain-containing protein n=1 Tax=Streptomyces bobili TaxID=67280 RepID=UPI0036505F4F